MSAEREPTEKDDDRNILACLPVEGNESPEMVALLTKGSGRYMADCGHEVWLSQTGRGYVDSGVIDVVCCANSKCMPWPGPESEAAEYNPLPQALSAVNEALVSNGREPLEKEDFDRIITLGVMEIRNKLDQL